MKKQACAGFSFSHPGRRRAGSDRRLVDALEEAMPLSA
jgi:hypothetical protein